MKVSTAVIIVVVVALVGFFIFRQANQFPLPKGETVPLSDTISNDGEQDESMDNTKDIDDIKKDEVKSSGREIFVTDGVKHSIPLDEILSGGPAKDGIPAINDPKFVNTKEADKFLDDSSVGLGLTLNGINRFYPYLILVWHELANDNIGGQAVLVSYCPLCATGVVFDSKVGGVDQEFGVSGKLWQSNLLMYNRSGNEDTESLWSQVLGEAVVGPNTGEKLAVIPADTVLYGKWKEAHPDTDVLSRDTGFQKSYGADPYGDYYTSTRILFDTGFDDTRLHPKEYVLGIEIGGKYKAYREQSIDIGETADTFNGKSIKITKDTTGKVRMFVDGSTTPIEIIGGFWFSWLAVHPDTELLD